MKKSRSARNSVSATCLLMAVLATPAWADDATATSPTSPSAATTAPTPQPGEQPTASAGHPTNDRETIKALADDASPYVLKLQYTGELWDNVQGGLKRGSDYLQNIDAQFGVDTEKAFGWKGGRFFVEAFYNNDRSPDNQLVGPIQDPSWIDTGGTQVFRLYQAYYDQKIDTTGTDVLLGIYDIQYDFAHSHPMDIFFNGAYAWNTALDQSGYTGPSTYPSTAPTVRVKQKIDDEWSVQAALSDAAADNPQNPPANDIILSPHYGAFLIGEVDYTPAKYTKVMAGYWGYTGQFDALNETNAAGAARQIQGEDGGYIGGATRLYTQEGRRGLDGFANLGFADPTTSIVDRSINAGLTYTGLLDARPADKLGVAVAVAGASSPYKKEQIAQGAGVYDYETNFELTYRAPVTSWLTLQPDLQYWIHPGVSTAQRNDLIVGLHFEIGHLFNF